MTGADTGINDVGDQATITLGSAGDYLSPGGSGNSTTTITADGVSVDDMPAATSSRLPTAPAPTLYSSLPARPTLRASAQASPTTSCGSPSLTESEGHSVEVRERRYL